jgi:hypothetical protein
MRCAVSHLHALSSPCRTIEPTGHPAIHVQTSGKIRKQGFVQIGVQPKRSNGDSLLWFVRFCLVHGKDPTQFADQNAVEIAASFIHPGECSLRVTKRHPHRRDISGLSTSHPNIALSLLHSALCAKRKGLGLSFTKPLVHDLYCLSIVELRVMNNRAGF